MSTKLQQLLDIEAMTKTEMAEHALFEGTCPGICMNPGCDYTTFYEPDQTEGWCECCGTNTVKSGLVLAGLI